MRGPGTAAGLDERGGPADLEGAAHLAERVAVVAHDPARFGTAVAEFLGAPYPFDANARARGTCNMTLGLGVVVPSKLKLPV